MRYLVSLTLAAATVALGAPALATGATSAGSLPTLNIALTGARGISVSGSTVSGAVNVVTTFKGRAPQGQGGPAVGIVRLNPGTTIEQATGAVQSHHGDLNALTPYGTLLVASGAPSRLQTVLTPGSYVALNLTSNGQPGLEPFTVTKSSSPAALPAARATETTIEFGFRGPTVLHNNTIVRATNGGYLVHMLDMFRVKNAAVGRAVLALLREGKDRAVMALLGRHPVDAGLMGPVSPGAVQQRVLHTQPGYYVQACFMDTQDGREHIVLGMERLVRVVG